MALHLADFFIIQAAITIAVHLLEHRDDAAVKLGLVDHAVGVKIKHLKPLILAAGEFFKADHTIIIDVELFGMNLSRLCNASSISALASPVMMLPDTRRPAPIRTGHNAVS